MAAAAPFAARLVVVLALGQRLFLEKRLTIGDRNLIIVRMNFGKSEKAVSIAAVVNEGRLQRRLHAGHFGEVDVAAQRPLVRRLEVELLDPVTSQNHHPGFFRVGGVDDHLVWPCKTLSRRARIRVEDREPFRLSRARRLCWRWEKIGNGRFAAAVAARLVRDAQADLQAASCCGRDGHDLTLGTSST